jgi:hypothetical protein
MVIYDTIIDKPTPLLYNYSAVIDTNTPLLSPYHPPLDMHERRGVCYGAAGVGVYRLV